MTGDSTSGTDSVSLLKHLQESFAALHNAHDVHLTALVSTPKRTTSLFPYTTHHHRCFQVDYLITLSCEVDSASAASGTSASTTEPAIANGQQDVNTRDPKEQKHDEESVGTSTSNDGKKRVLTTALSAHLYIIPHHQSSILYISKLDSSGYPTIPLPLTRTFITSVLRFFILPDAGRPTPHVRIQLFARSQGQYLFPNSAEGPKKVLGGLGLCGWWKGVYEEAAATAKTQGRLKLGMVLPGYSSDEARGMLAQRRPLPEGVEWSSTPPFGNPLPASASSSTPASLPSPSLANLIPSFPDDPKSRFLDDLVSEGAEDPHRRRKLLGPKGESGSSSSIASSSSASASRRTDTHRAKLQAEDEAERRFTQATLERVSKEEYWERMGFRQECISGDVTGFFSLESDSPLPSGATGDPVAGRTALPPEIVDRLLVALLNTDFKTYTSGIDHTAIWDRAVKSVVVDEIGQEGYEGCIATIKGKGPAASTGHGQQGADVIGEQVKRKEEPVVTMLQPRKKKKTVA